MRFRFNFRNGLMHAGFKRSYGRAVLFRIVGLLQEIQNRAKYSSYIQLLLAVHFASFMEQVAPLPLTLPRTLRIGCKDEGTRRLARESMPCPERGNSAVAGNHFQTMGDLVFKRWDALAAGPLFNHDAEVVELLDGDFQVATNLGAVLWGWRRAPRRSR